MTFDPRNGRIAFPELGLAFDPALKQTEFLQLPSHATALARLRHDPSFRYQLPAIPQADSQLYVLLRFDYERLASISMLHQAARFDEGTAGGSEAAEMARKVFHERWLATQFGVNCQRYRWGKVSSNYDREMKSSSILIEYAKQNAWQTVGRTAGRMWGAASSRR